MEQSNSPEVHIEYVRQRRRQRRVVGVLAALAVVVGVLAVFGLAYARQYERVEDLENQNASILSDHHAIGEQFAEQSKRLAEQTMKLESAIRSSYGQGFVAGQEALRLPVGLRPLAQHAAAGLLVPRRVPESIGQRPRVTTDRNGYTIRWPRVAVFASRSEPLSNWTRQALGRSQRVELGPYRVLRLTGPSGVTYAWRKGRATYAVIAVPRYDAAARTLIASSR